MKILVDNRRAHHNYHILERYDVGLVLQGWEVKSIRAGRVQIGDSHAVFLQGELFLLNSHITPLSTTSTYSRPEVDRSRKLLLHAQEIRRLIGKSRESGLSLVPLNLYLKRGKIKSTVALVQGKKKYDKRRDIETRDWKRQQARILRGR